MNSREFREVGHRVVDLLSEYLEHIEEKPVFPNVAPSTLTQLFAEPLPQDSSPPEKVLGELEKKLLPHCTHVGHPGYMGLITPSPNPIGIIADFICSALNQNIGAYSIGPAAVAMERRTVRWLSDLVGYAETAGGNLTSGGTMANFIGLKLARDYVSSDRIQQEGVHERWAVYTSEERHVSIDKAVDAVGVGRSALRALPTDAQFGLRLDALEAAIAEDHKLAYGRCASWASSAPPIPVQSTRCASFGLLRIERECGFTLMPPMEAACYSPARGPCAMRGWSSRTLSPSTLTSGSTLRWMRERSWSRMTAD
jgi:aromatic-L-amino-acid decarboxylase